MRYPRRAVLLLSLIAGTVRATGLHDNSEACDCYVTSGSSSAFYSNHRFFDFRGIRDASGLYDQEPANVTGDEDVGQKGFLNSTAFAKDWGILTWSRDSSPESPIALRNALQNVYIQMDTNNSSMSHLTLRTYRSSDFSATAEVENLQRDVFHSSIRFRTRVYGASGAVAGLFTYLNDSTESDIEILTRDPPNHIRYTNQPSTGSDGYTVTAASTDAQLPGSIVWTDWNTHRMDWTSKISTWYVNDIFVANKTYGIPQFPSYLTLNMWSNGGLWSENMTEGDAAYLEIQWIDMVFNTSEPVTPSKLARIKPRSGGCGTVCTVDNVDQPGFPKIVSKASAYFHNPITYRLSILIFGVHLLVMIIRG